MEDVLFINGKCLCSFYPSEIDAYNLIKKDLCWAGAKILPCSPCSKAKEEECEWAEDARQNARKGMEAVL
jgi:hypothetical protein